MSKETLTCSFSCLDVHKLDPTRFQGGPVDAGLVMGDINAFRTSRTLGDLDGRGAGNERSGEDDRDE